MLREIKRSSWPTLAGDYVPFHICKAMRPDSYVTRRNAVSRMRQIIVSRVSPRVSRIPHYLSYLGTVCSLSCSSHTLFQHNSHRGGEAYFIVCSFPLGNRRARLLLLRQSGGEGQIPEPRPGGVHVPPVHGHRIAALWSAQAGIPRIAK